jgi:hypothetical protein
VWAILLTPIGVGVSWAVMDVVGAIGSTLDFWIPVAAGMAIWMVIYGSLPRPMWLYVVGHELTHALWSLLFGGRVKSMKVGARGGHVVVTRSNTLVVLAPYFFPLYAMIWVVVYQLFFVVLGGVTSMFWFHLGLAVAYAFHVTLTVSVLRVRQPDIEGEGWIFSGVIIWVSHALLLLVSLAWVSGRVSQSTAWGFVLRRMGRTLRLLLDGLA